MKISYELAEQLKSAGFLQHLPPIGVFTEATHRPACTQNGCHPTLDELIDACGDKFDCVAYGSGIDLQKKSRIIPEEPWKAVGINLKPELQDGWGVTEHAHGKTPEEAVAKLWLMLNKK